jgi:hypothetical protein
VDSDKTVAAVSASARVIEVLRFYEFPLALASGEDWLEGIGFSRTIWLKPIPYVMAVLQLKLEAIYQHSKYRALVQASPLQRLRRTEEQLMSPLIPMRNFSAIPKNIFRVVARRRVSGVHAALGKPHECFVQKINSDRAAVRVTSAKERSIAGFAWKTDDRLIFVQDTGGDENYHLYAVDADGSNTKDLTPFPKVQAQLVDDLEDNPAEVLVGLNKRNPQIFDVYRLNTNTGEMIVVAENPGNISRWRTDWDGHVRAAVATDGVNNTLLYRATEADAFMPLVTTDFKESITPLRFTFDNKSLYVASNIGRDKEQSSGTTRKRKAKSNKFSLTQTLTRKHCFIRASAKLSPAFHSSRGNCSTSSSTRSAKTCSANSNNACPVTKFVSRVSTAPKINALCVPSATARSALITLRSRDERISQARRRVAMAGRK